MSRRRDERARVLGPYKIKRDGTWQVTAVDPSRAGKDGRGGREPRFFSTEAEANEYKELKERAFARRSGVTLAEAIEVYAEALATKGTGEISRHETTRRLRLFFPDLNVTLARVTPERAQDYYDAFRERRKENGDLISADYHRCALINARSLFKWARREGLMVEANPFAEVEGVGRRSAGKEQHTGDEVRRLYAYLLPLAEEDTLAGRAALGCLMLLLMALRSGDVSRRIVRDVDLDATQLIVRRGKTAKSNRPRYIPEVLRPLLRRLIAGRDPFEPLFRSPWTESGHHTHRWLYQALEKFCDAAGVPRVCPHALKGTAGSVLAETGTAGDIIADHLSHEDRGTTERHYVAAGAGEAAKTRKAFEVIAGGLGK